MPIRRTYNTWNKGAYKPGQGYQFWFASAWYQSVETGKWTNGYAAEKPIYNADFTKMTMKLRNGLYWSDGVEFTADDVLFTVNTTMKTQGLRLMQEFNRDIAKVEAVDKYTLDFTLKRSNPKFHNWFTILQCAESITPMPKHVFEGKDPLTYNSFPPVTLSGYVLKDYDRNGYWLLYERRKDAERSLLAQVKGARPVPEYVFVVDYGPEDKGALAQAGHQLDIKYYNGVEAWDIISKKNPDARAWYKDYPYAWMNDPSARCAVFNKARAPFDNKNVRWALALAINMSDLPIAVYNGMTRPTALYANPNNIHMEAFYKPMKDWLLAYQMEDGYKPFDPTIAKTLADYAKRKGYPFSGTPEDVWGIGWWKYDTKQAEKILLKEGFKKDSAGKWLKPNGTPFTATFIVQAGDYQRIALVVADYWRSFGVDVTINTLERNVYTQRRAVGDYDVTITEVETQGAPIDLFFQLYGLHSRYYVKEGEVAFTNVHRWKVPARVDQIIDELGSRVPDDPKIRDLMIEFLKIGVQEMPLIPLLSSTKMVIVDNYYWSNWPSAANAYEAPFYWCMGNLEFVSPFLKATGAK